MYNKYDRNDKKLRLNRDLQIAIAEYAPGSEVIANGKIYRSQYVKMPYYKKSEALEEYDYGICKNKECRNMVTIRHINNNKNEKMKNCSICGSEFEKCGTFIIPKYGFISASCEEASTRKPEKTYKTDIYYTDNNIDKEYTINKEHNINGNIIKVRAKKNGEMSIVNTSDFCFCPICGYTVKLKNKKDFKEHKNIYGRECTCDTPRIITFGHKYKTDVACIEIEKDINYEKALSILYDLLEGVSKYYNIKREDISGCINYYINYGKKCLEFVLFDTVPGGAGHITRLANADTNEFIEMLKSALSVVEKCICGGKEGDCACYSCLCNYYNQKYHDILKRKYAIDFLNKILYNK